MEMAGTGRLWQTLILQKWEPIFAYLPVESMILAHQSDYYTVLNAANTQGSSTVFVEFMLEMILDALKNVYVEQHGSSAGPVSRRTAVGSSSARRSHDHSPHG